MALITRTYTISAKDEIKSAHWDDLNTIYSEFNGNIDNANIKAAAAIAISKTALGTFTDWTAWTPGYTGFSANPTISYARYTQIGKLAMITYKAATSGTSNATTFTITGLPVTPLRAATFTAYTIIDNGVTAADSGIIETAASSTTITLYKDNAGTGWTASGSKSVNNFFIICEV